jgi:hypothetical protein
MYTRLALNSTVLTTVLTTGLIASTVAFSTSASAADYYVRHDFSGILGGTPNLVGGRVTGSTTTDPGGQPDSYNLTGIALGNPLGVLVTDSATSVGSYSQAFATSTATAFINGNTITGTTIASGSAFASPPPIGTSYATATSSAQLTAGQLGINPFGQFTWKPLFWDSVSGEASDSARRRVRDPIAFTITDPTTQNVLRTGNLLDISADFDTGSIQWGVADNPSDPGDGSTPPAEDDKLDIAFTNNGLFTIDLTDSAVTNPGLFQITAVEGIITDIKKTGRFDPLTGLPSVGDSSTFSIPFSSVFPKEIPVDFIFNGLNGGNQVNVAYTISGDGGTEAVAVPWETDALSVVGSTVLFGLGVWTKRKRKLSESSTKDNIKTS